MVVVVVVVVVVQAMLAKSNRVSQAQFATNSQRPASGRTAGEPQGATETMAVELSEMGQLVVISATTPLTNNGPRSGCLVCLCAKCQMCSRPEREALEALAVVRTEGAHQAVLVPPPPKQPTYTVIQHC